MKPIRVCDELANRPNIHSLKREIHEVGLGGISIGLSLRYFDRDMIAIETLLSRVKRELQDE